MCPDSIFIGTLVETGWSNDREHDSVMRISEQHEQCWKLNYQKYHIKV